MKLATFGIGMTLAVALCGVSAWAQSPPAAATPANEPTQIFYLTNVSEQHEVQEILTAIRNMVSPTDKIYLVPSQNAIIISAPPDHILMAQKLINELDRPRKTYRLTYTIAEMDSGKRIGIQHFAMVVVSGQRTDLKQGTKVPVITGTMTSPGSTSAQTQFTYIDVGLNLTATLDESANGVRLRTKAEQSSVAEGASTAGPNDPVVRQTILEGTSILTPGKPLVLGSIDVPGSTRHLDVEVVMEVVR